MSLSPGARIGVYDVLSKLGEGGMGAVYRARDAKLGREVAIKVLPDAFATDAERLARFEREARTLAALNHPHIAQIYGFEQSGDVSALVMELVEGEDLADRLTQGPIPCDEALPIARQIAEALEAAHEQGIIHRDLKPANIKVRPDGTVKVLDFGLAKALDQDLRTSGPHDLANSPTITSPAMTMRGVILGTAAYMAPEQAKGKAVDRRADIWAFGCVLYEMLTGQRTFAGEDISDTLVSILRDDPRWQALPADTPPQVRALLRRCLQKDPQKRLPHIGSARLELSDAGAVDVQPPPITRRFAYLTPVVAGVVAGALVAGGVAFGLRPAPPAPPAPVQFAIELPPGHRFPGGNRVPRFAVAPDGRSIVYQAEDGKSSTLRIRSLASLEERIVPGSESGVGGNDRQQPFWSPDGRWIAYFDELAGQLRRVNLDSGTTQTVTRIEGNQFGGTWNDEDVLLVASVGTRGVQRVAASGDLSPVTTVNEAAGELHHLWPEFLPDGRHFTFYLAFANDRPPEVHVASIDGGASTKLFESLAMARPQWPDRLLFESSGALFSQRFDLSRLALSGEPTQVAERVDFTQAGRIGVSASRTGVLAYTTGAIDDGQETFWVDRQGREIAQAPSAVVGLSGLRLSPDGRYLAYGRAAGSRTGRAVNGLWIQDVTRGIESRVADGAVALGVSVAFSPDGTRVAYRRAAPAAYVTQVVSGAAPPAVQLQEDELTAGAVLDWSPDGRHLLVSRGGPTRGLWIVPVDGGQPALYFTDRLFLGGATFSPDGRFVAHAAGTVFDRQVVLQPFPDASAGKWTVSLPGAAYPRWRRDGRELYFVSSDGRLMAVPIATNPAMDIGAPVPLFQMPPFSGSFPYDVTADGQRFVLLRARTAELARQKLIVTVNWSETP